MPTREEIRRALLKQMEAEVGEAPASLADEEDLRDGLGLDSVDVIGLVMRIERHYHIRLATEELAPIVHVGELVDLLEAKLRGAAGADAPPP